MSLFSKEKTIFNLPDAEMEYFPNFLKEKEADLYFNKLLEDTNWQRDDIKVFGKTYPQPRLTALYGDNGKPYSYSKITMHPMPLSSHLLELKKKVESYCGHQFSTVLLNLYRDGDDSNGWHADNEKELGKNPVVASLSLGAERYFKIKHRTNTEEKHKLILEHGSLLVMKGTMQHHWLHQIPKTKKIVGKRINLTFRKIGSI